MSCDVKIICACKINHLVYFPFIGSLLSQVIILVENVENENNFTDHKDNIVHVDVHTR